MSAAIRDAAAADLPGIDAIYAYEVHHGVATFDTEPRHPAETLAWFDGLRARELPVRVAVEGDRVVGYACLSPWSPKAAYSITAETTFYVAPDRRGAGIGRTLLADLIARAEARALELLVARIESSGGGASRHLHRALGFRMVGTLHGVGRKHGRLLDVDILEREIGRGGGRGDRG